MKKVYSTHIAIWLPAGLMPLGVFLVRQYVSSSLPYEMIDATHIGNANEFQIFAWIMFPLMRPSLEAIAIIVTVDS